MYQNGCTIEVHVKNRPVNEYFHKGKHYIEGRNGSEYTVFIKNSTKSRKKLVISIDGLNVLTGDNTWDIGYVINPYDNLVIPGWRISDREIAKFNFSSLKDSYNNHNNTGKIQNVGVIGCMVFDEITIPAYQPSWTYKKYISNPIYDYPVYPKYVVGYPELVRTAVDNKPFNSINVNSQLLGVASGTTTSTLGYSYETGMSAACTAIETSREEQSVGTGWGDVTDFKTVDVNFNFNKEPTSTMLLFYDDSKGLKRRGINIKEPTIEEPEAFPGYNKFGCPLPK